MTVQDCVFQAIDITNQSYPQRKPIEKSADCVLFGSEGVLDSLGLVTLIVDIEGLLSDNLNLQLTLVNDKAFSLKYSPFKTVGTLIEYIEKLAAEAKS
jgi:acyl carrier protein